MTFIMQLRLLCWKNFTIRRRQKKRFIIEILWPLTLFLILMWVRTRQLKEYIHECHFEKKALFSAGFVPAIQTYICSMNNTCKKDSIEDESGFLTLYDKSTATQFIVDLDEFISTQLTPSNIDTIQKIFAGVLSNLNTTALGSTPPTSLFALIPILQKILNTTSTSEIIKRVTDLRKVGDAASKLVSKYNKTVQDLIKTNDSQAIASQVLCGSDTKNMFAGIELSSKNRIETMFRRREDLDNTTLNVNEGNDPRCRVFLSFLTTAGPWTALFWNFAKPLIQGKILYYPNKDIIRRIMDRVDQSFEPLHEISRLAENWLVTTSPALRSIFTSNSTLITFAMNSLFGNIPREGQIDRVLSGLNMIDLISTNITQFFACFEFNKTEAIDSQEELEKTASNLIEKKMLWAAIVFKDNKEYSNNTLPPYVQYKIRMDAYRTSPTFTLKLPTMPDPKRMPLRHLQFLYFGFAYVQDLIERSIIFEQTNVTSPVGFWLQQFPFPCRIMDFFIIAIARSFPMFMTLAWVYSAAMIIRSIVYEKEKRLKEVMRMMGLGNAVHWCGWFINSLVMMMITIFLLTIILKYGHILENSNPIIIFMYLLCFAVATIMLSFMLSSCFFYANLAAAAGGMIYFVWYLPYAFLIRWDEHLTHSIRQLVSIFSNVAFGFGCSYFAHVEETGIGVQWDNIAGSDAWPEFDYTLSDSMLMLLFDSLLYCLIAVYLEQVAPGQFGIPLPWYFCLQPRYWFPRKTLRTAVNSGYRRTRSAGNFEAEPANLPVGISIIDLHKKYSDGKVAIEDISLNFYEGQITSFLGHNGAGKTTTISILTGLFPPTSGTAYINGIDIRSGMHLIRQHLGICPQHDVLFDLLTVREHLWFYARLKGMHDAKVLNKEIDDMIENLGLVAKTNARVNTLSGGMKRKLSIGIAFIGGSKVVILDEPTAGVDPKSRRAIWDLLLKFKKGRTILLTTHFMDEADVLGDRIAIISNGRLRCCGSSLFLKKKFGKGYHLTVVKENAKNPAVRPVVETYVKKFVPDVQMKEEVGYEITFILPSTAENIANFNVMLQGLEANKKLYGISGYGITDSTLEEIFLNVSEERETAGKSEAEDAAALEKLLSEPSTLEVNKVEKFALVYQQFRALLIIRFFHTRRNIKALFAEIILPCVFVCIAFIMTLAVPPITSYPPMELHLYHGTKDNYIFFNQFDTSVNTSTHSYVDLLMHPPHLGTRCVNPEPLNEKCDGSFDGTHGLISEDYLKFNSSQTCSCNYGTMVCPKDLQTDAPTITLATRDSLSNVTGFNVSDWLLKTHMKFSSNRYGGYTFDMKNTKSVQNFCVLKSILDNLTESINGIKINVTCEYQNVTDIIVWFNNRRQESPVAYLNAFNNIILRAGLTQDKDPRDYGISVINHPLEFTAVQAMDNVRLKGGVTVLQAVCVVFAMSFVPASFVLFLIAERINDFKHLQFVSGVKPYIYWIASFVWNLMVYSVSATLCIILFLIFDDNGFTSKSNFIPVCALLFLYGWATIPLMYPFSFLFDVPSMAFVSLSCCNLFIGITSTLATFMLEIMDDEELQEIGIVLKQVFLIFPQYCLGRGLIELKTYQLTLDALTDFGYEPKKYPFEWTFIGRNIFSMVVCGIVCFILTLLIEYKFFVTRRMQEIGDDTILPVDDEDVANERNKVLSGNYETAVLRVENLQKVYFTWTLKKFLSKFFCPSKQNEGTVRAVDKICFAVERGECFGLLGVNGAGKTTTFKMLTGDIRVSGGNAYLMGHSILSEMHLVRQNIGYCPQFNAIDGLLTCEEHLRIFAVLKGVQKDDVQKSVDWTIKKLSLESHRKRRAESFSGGNKRKLCTAIAFIGNPSIVFLDEPTTGMDPGARRFLWNTMLNILKGGQSIVLTSHSLEECEALCTRLAIMVSGRFMCIGSTQHLKNRFGGGYTLSVRVNQPRFVNDVIDYVKTEFPSATIKEQHPTHVQFSIPQERLVISHLFGSMAKVKVQLGIADYSITQTTLDQVFINFATDEKTRD